MDREIPKEVLQRERKKRIIKISGVIVAIIAIIVFTITMLRDTIHLKNIKLSEVEIGTIDVTVSASGKVLPAFEEIINTPIESRIVEVYKKAGDSVVAGTPLLKLDLQSIETDYRKMLDELQMRQYNIERLKINNKSSLSNTEMQLKVNDMKLDKMSVEVKNERYLDSIGAGTTEKVREAELNYRVAKLEQEQSKNRYENDKQVADAEIKAKELELEIFRKSLAETKRILDDAQIRSPRKATLTYINNQVGVRVPQGTQIAIISDLSQFKIEGEIADSYGDKISTGSKAVVIIGNEKLSGVVSSVTPLSKNGVIQFSVQLDDPANSRLRSGLKTDVYVMNAVKEGVMRIANSSYYSGKGSYNLFVLEGKNLIRKTVLLGESNYEYVEVVSGLQTGDRVVISNMTDYRNKHKIGVKTK